MRTLLLLLAPLFCITSFAGEKFDLVSMMRRSQDFPAPDALRKQLAADPDNHASLLRCKAEKKSDLDIVESFFAAVEVKLTKSGHRSFLMFPSTYCPEFFGAHSIPFWVMEETPNGTYIQLFWQVVDSVEILNSRNNGYRDIATRYGFEDYVIARFNGRIYK
jgi:hypothetical protein